MSDFTADDILTGVTEGERARRQAVQYETFRDELREALADPEGYSISVLGRNGKKLTFNYGVPLGYALELEEYTENEEPSYHGDPFWRSPFIAMPPVLKRRFHGLTVRRQRDQEFTSLQEHARTEWSR